MDRRWPVSDDDREKVVQALMMMVESGDPEAATKAAMLLVRVDRLNLQAEIENRRLDATEEGRRLKLIRLAQKLPAGEIKKIAERLQGENTDVA